MMSSTKKWIGLLMMLGCLSTWGACSDDGDGNQDTGGAADAALPDLMVGNASVSGTVGRTISTCPPMKGGVGTLCLELRTTCTDATTKVASTSVAKADMSWPTNTVPFKIEKVPNGALQLYGFLDDDDSGCNGGLTAGDFYYVAGCVAVTVSDGADVAGVTLTFDGKKM